MSASVPASVSVSVRLGNDNRARAGYGGAARIANSTSSPEIAAVRAAAKFFRCPESQVALQVIDHGDTCAGIPARYVAHGKEVRRV